MRLLWDVCQVPDFRKVMSDQHAKLLAQIFPYLEGGGRLPADWVEGHVNRLDRIDGDIDTLVARIAHVRTWTYVVYRPSWIADPLGWQDRTRAIEDRLSDALHERLTQRFVDRRSAGLVRSLAKDGILLAGIQADGAVVVEGHPIGRIDGFRFTPDATALGPDAKPVLMAARRALRSEIARRIAALEQAAGRRIRLRRRGRDPLARFAGGPAGARQCAPQAAYRALDRRFAGRGRGRAGPRSRGAMARRRDRAPVPLAAESWPMRRSTAPRGDWSFN